MPAKGTSTGFHEQRDFAILGCCGIAVLKCLLNIAGEVFPWAPKSLKCDRKDTFGGLVTSVIDATTTMVIAAWIHYRCFFMDFPIPEVTIEQEISWHFACPFLAFHAISRNRQ